MTIQTRNLVMVGLGVKDDRPPNEFQPPLIDGIHLRWAFNQKRGFPWFGYHLYRRPHLQGELLCISDEIKKHIAGPMASSKRVEINYGVIASDTDLLFRVPTAEIDLSKTERNFVRFQFYRSFIVRAVQVKISFQSNDDISIIAKWDDAIIFRTQVSGIAGEQKIVPIEADIITSLEIGSGEAILTDICFVPVLQDASKGWESVRDASPICLPLTHPDYPCSKGSENLEESRELAMRRILYGHPDRLFRSPTILHDKGKIIVNHDSPLVIGIDTEWEETEKLTGNVLRVNGDLTAYVILQVIAPDRIILSRPYLGDSADGRPYQIIQDNYAQIHDHLAILAHGGPAGMAMSSKTTPPPIYSIDTIDARTGKDYFRGSGVKWGNELQGLKIRIGNDNQAYRIDRVNNNDTLSITSQYLGRDGVSRYEIFTDLEDPKSDESTPHAAKQSPLGLILLAAIDPAIAQMLGLYWIDQTTNEDESYDYLILADHTKDILNNPDFVLNDKSLEEILLQRSGEIDGFIVFNKQITKSPPLIAPRGLRVYALPEMGLNENAKIGGCAGLVWDIDTYLSRLPLTNQTILYQLWRADLDAIDDPPQNKPSSDKYKRINEKLGVSRPGNFPQRPEYWPPFDLHYFDANLSEGWYSYKISGIDIFGRHSEKSNEAKWFQWTPVPNPRPWYYRDPPRNSEIHPFAVALFDKNPPPSPAGVEAFALDPRDPYQVKDASYTNWWNKLVATSWYQALREDEKNELIGLRVRWRWPDSFQNQAPDTREFRIYYQSGSLNSDFSKPNNWEERFHVVSYGDNWKKGSDDSFRSYEIFLPDPNGPIRLGLPLKTSSVEPIVYAHIGVSAADNKEHTKDDPQREQPERWANGYWGGNERYGNEGRISSPVTIFRIHRLPPEPPTPPPDSERVFATPADYHNQSYYTYRWEPGKKLKTHIFRALDETIFMIDHKLFSSGQRSPLNISDKNYFPLEWHEDNEANRLRRQRVVKELNELYELEVDERINGYRALSNDALRVLAGLPGNEKAFSQITNLPLEPSDPKTFNSRGPNDPDEFVIGDSANPLASESLRIYIDALDGRATNRYFYRAAYVDEVQNLGQLSLSSPPVYLPNVVPPQAPVITKVLGGDREITLQWASNREPDLVSYRVYRTEDKQKTRDIRLMKLVHTNPVPSGDLISRPAVVSWTDKPVPGLREFWYCIVAVAKPDSNSPLDGVEKFSKPSQVYRMRAYDLTPPDPPTLTKVDWVRVDFANNVSSWSDPIPPNKSWTPAVHLEWAGAEAETKLLVQVKRSSDESFSSASGWLEPGTTAFLHKGVSMFETYEYRLKVVTNSGNVNNRYSPFILSPP